MTEPDAPWVKFAEQRSDHRLAALFAPRSIALVGASRRPETAGRTLFDMARIDGYRGAVHLVNPSTAEIEGEPCHATLAEVPDGVDHAALAVPNAALEATLDQVIERGIKAATIFASCHLDDDRQPMLAERLRAKARKAGVALVGGNSMGFYNPGIGLRVASFPSIGPLRSGGVAWIAQSGSAFSALTHNDRRLGFSLCVSSGMELATTVADHMDFALSLAQTRVIGLFLETVRDPAGFVAALERAARQDVPVVALKIGRSARAAAMAVSHTGAIAGDDAAYQALFRHHGVIRVDDLDEMMATLTLLQHERCMGAGGLASVHDSGGERELAVDVADDLGLAYAPIGKATVEKLSAVLDPGLEPENPCDAWGTGRDYKQVYATAMQALAEDPAVGLTLFMTELRDNYWYSAGIAEAVRQAARASGKPIGIATNFSKTANREISASLAEDGIPVLEGTREALLAVRHAMHRRDWQPAQTGAELGAQANALIRAALSQHQASGQTSGEALSEAEGLELLALAGVRTPRMVQIDAVNDIAAALHSTGLPVVLKSAAAGLAHKSDVGGVVLGLASPGAVVAAYRDMSARLGPQALLATQVPAGVELALGAIIDPGFGPVVMIGAGGVQIELLDDRIYALAPFDAAEAVRLINALRIAPLLAGYRGQPAADLAALAEAVSRFSAFVAAAAEFISEIDVNPLIATPDGAFAVDCLIVPKPS